MDYPSKIIGELVGEFSKLPGIGKRTALRMVLNLLKQKNNEVENLGNLIIRLTKDVKYCKYCHTITENDLCEICADPKRDKKCICIVEDHRDLIAIENTQQFKGTFHVLGGLISPIDGIGPENLNIGSLMERIYANDIQEVIFALSATMEGDTTMFYITKQIDKIGIKTSAISRGISVGGELEYADELTLGRSIMNRTPFNM